MLCQIDLEEHFRNLKTILEIFARLRGNDYSCICQSIQFDQSIYVATDVEYTQST